MTTTRTRSTSRRAPTSRSSRSSGSSAKPQGGLRRASTRQTQTRGSDPRVAKQKSAKQRPKSKRVKPKRRKGKRGTVGSDRFAPRRREVRREQNARRFKVIAILAAISMVAVGCIGLLNSALLDVDRFNIVGASRTEPDSIVDASGIVAGDPLVDLDSDAAVDGIRQLPWISEAEVRRRWSGVVEISVVERQPFAALPTANGFVFVDDTGIQLERTVERPSGFLPVVGVEASGQLGEVAPPESALVLSLQAALTPELREQSAAIVVEPIEVLSDATNADANTDSAKSGESGHGVFLALRQGGQVNFGDSSDLGGKLLALETVLARVDLSCITMIDVRVPSAPAVRRGTASGLESAQSGDEMAPASSEQSDSLSGSSGSEVPETADDGLEIVDIETSTPVSC